MYRKILIATDGSELAGKAVDQGVELAKTLGAAVTFVTVTERLSALDMAEEAQIGESDPIGRYRELTDRTADAILAAAKTVGEKAGVACEGVHVGDSVPAEGIIEVAQKESSDLIVMASHGRRGLNRLMLGSQTAEVLAHSKVPVLVLR